MPTFSYIPIAGQFAILRDGIDTNERLRRETVAQQAVDELNRSAQLTPERIAKVAVATRGESYRSSHLQFVRRAKRWR